LIADAKKTRRGFTLVEILVVLAIAAVLTALSIPAITRLGLFARDELSGTSRELFQLLRAARVYAATYNVETAVVYNLDNYLPIEIDPNNQFNLPSPVVDTQTGQTLRLATAAAVMYKLPTARAPFDGKFVAVPGQEGIFKSFPNDICVLLERSKRLDPDNDDDGPLYTSQLPRVGKDGSIENLGKLGMSRVQCYLDGYGPYSTNIQSPADYEAFPAHVFTPGGRLKADGATERYVFYVAPRPDTPIDDRITIDGTLISVPIELYRSTGRVQLATGS